MRSTVSSPASNTYPIALLQGYLIEGSDPKSLIETYTSFSGRMGPLPLHFTKGLIVGWEGGTDVVRKYWRQVVDAGVKVSAIWLQDWTGIREDTFGSRLWWNWELDTTFYHDWKNLVDELESDGAVMTTYINPFLAANVGKEKANFTRDLFKEAAGLGYLVKNKDGEPYILTSGSQTFTFGTIVSLYFFFGGGAERRRNPCPLSSTHRLTDRTTNQKRH